MQGSATDILVIEDNPHDAELTLHALRDVVPAGAIAVAEDGAAALEWFFGAAGLLAGGGARLPRVVFVDLKLPRVDGLTVIKRLKGDPRTQGMPLVVLTSSAEQGDVAESYRLGANGYLVKPVAYDQYMSMVSQAGRYWVQVNFGAS